MFEFYGNPAAPQPNLREKFNIYLAFLQLCADSPAKAADQLRGTKTDQAVGAEMVARFGKEFRRLQVDLRHDWERRLMTLRHNLEGELLEKDIDLHQVPALQIDSLLERLVPDPSVQPALSAFALPAPHPSYSQNITVNQNFISAVEATVIQDVQGTVHLGEQAKDVLALIDRLGGLETVSLRSAVHELEDPEAPKPRKAAAQARLKTFLSQLGAKAQDAAFSILEKYIESKLGI
jgi:hypothetical protein